MDYVKRTIFYLESLYSSHVITLVISLLSVYLPKITLDGIARQWNWNTIVISIGSLSILIAILNFFQARASAGFEVIQNINRYHFMNEVEKVIMTCDYSEVENPNIQVKMKQAGDIVFTGNYYTGLNGLTNGSKDMLGNLLNFFCFWSYINWIKPYRCCCSFCYITHWLFCGKSNCSI